MTKKIKVNFTESDIQEMLEAVYEGDSDVFEWTFQTEDGEDINVLISVGDDDD